MKTANKDKYKYVSNFIRKELPEFKSIAEEAFGWDWRKILSNAAIFDIEDVFEFYKVMQLKYTWKRQLVKSLKRWIDYDN